MGYAGDKTTGFQSPATDFVENVTDLAQILDLRRPGRYPVRVVGQRLAARGIQSGDILVADAGADPKPGKICTRLYQETPAIAEDSPILMTKNHYKVFAKARGAIAIRANNRC